MKTENAIPRKKGAANKNTLFVVCMMAYPVLQFLVFFVYVNINTIKMSFTYFDWNIGETVVGLKYYREFFYELFNMRQMKIALKNSLLVAVNGIFIAQPLGIIFGYLVFKKIPWARIFKVIFFLPSIISIVVLTMVYKYMFDPTVGPIAALMSALGAETIPDFFTDATYAFPLVLLYCNWAGIGYSVLMVGGSMNRIPEEIIEYGKLEGLGMVKELVLIVVPLVWPMISTSLVLSCTNIFTFFIQVQLITGGSGDSTTIAYIINSLVSGGSQNLEKAAAFGICCSVFAAPVILIVKNVSERFFQDVSF